MRRAHVAMVALLWTACATSRSERPELRPAAAAPDPAPAATTAPAEVFRTHASRPTAKTANSTRACDRGDLVACHAAALDAYYAPPTPETDARARDLFDRACEGGYAPSCNGLGVLYEAGRGVAEDPEAAVALYRRACEADGSTGCQHLADRLRSGRGIAKDARAAERAEARGHCLFEASLKKDARTCPSLDGP